MCKYIYTYIKLHTITEKLLYLISYNIDSEKLLLIDISKNKSKTTSSFSTA